MGKAQRQLSLPPAITATSPHKSGPMIDPAGLAAVWKAKTRFHVSGGYKSASNDLPIGSTVASLIPLPS